MKWLGCLLASAVVCCAQMSSGVSLSNGIKLQISANATQAPNQQTLTASLEPADGNSVFRVFRDQNQLAVFAYELKLDRSADGDSVRITVIPAGNGFARRFPGADGGKPTPTVPTSREFAAVRSGQTVNIELYDVPPNGKVSDDVTVTLNRPGSANSNVADRNAHAQDRIRFAGIRVFINRRQVAGDGARAVVSGRYAMFYIPGRGGYFFSTDNPEGRGFVKAGFADRLRMEFTLDNESIECTADQAILQGDTRGEIWAYHDPNYRPQGNLTRSDANVNPRGPDEFFTAASDSLKWWLP